MSRLARQFTRHVRGLRIGTWLLVALVVFVSSEFVLRTPGMVASGASLHSGHHQQTENQPKAHSSSEHQPVSHDHRSCQLCAAPPIALPISSLSQLGKTRLALVDAVQIEFSGWEIREHRVGLRSRAPPALALSV